MIKSVNIDKAGLKGEVRQKKAQQCADALLTIYQSEMFKQMILDMDRERWLKGETEGSPFLTMTNEQIYKFIMEGKEEWNNEQDYEIDLIVGGYWGKWYSKVVGYMNPGKPKIFVNYRFYDKMSKKRVCSNFGHEYMHTLGARHSGPYLKQSFPYYMNKIIETCYDALIEDEEDGPLYKRVCKRSIWKLWLGKTCRMVRI